MCWHLIGVCAAGLEYILRLRYTVCLWRSTAHAHGWFFMDFELTPLVLLSTFFFGPKIVFSVHGSEETSLPTYCTMDNAGPDGDIFWISFAVVILRRQKVVRRVQFYWIMGYFSKIERRLQKNAPSGPRVHWKLSIWTIARRSWLLSWSDFGSKVYKVWPPTRDSSYKVTYSFWLCVCTRYLSICSPSFVALVWCNWELWVTAFGARNTPSKCIP